MRSVIRSSFCRRVAQLLVVAIALPLVAVPASAAPQPISVLVLTFDNKSGVGGDEMAQRVTDEVVIALGDTGRAAPTRLDPDSPSVKRAVDVERTLQKQDLQPPWDARKAAALGKVLGVESVLIGTVDQYSFDAKARKAQVILTVQRVQVAAPETPVPIAVNGASVTKVGAVQEGPLLNEAIADAASKLAQAVTGTAPTTKQAPQKPSISKRKNWLPVALAVVAGILLLGRGGGDRGPAAAGKAPISNALCEAQANSVALSWAVDTSGTPPEGFNIYRALAGDAPLGGTDRIGAAPIRALAARRGAIGPYEKIANASGTARGMNDSGAALGKVYAYQIRAIISGKESAAVDFKSRFEPADTPVVGPGVPVAPRGITVGPGAGSLVVRISWQPNPEAFVTGYRVYRGTSPTVLYLLGQFPSTQTTLDDARNTAANQTYYYVVAAVGPGVGGTPIERRSSPKSYTLTPGALGPPTNLTALPGQAEITLNWTPSIDSPVAGYNIYRNGTRIANVAGRTTSTYTDSSVTAGTNYTYWLRSYDASTPPRESADSNHVTAKTSLPAAKIDCSAVPIAIVGNGVDTATIKGLVKDSAGKPVGGAKVRFTLTTSGGGSLVVVAGGTKQANGDVVAPTDASGVAQAGLKAPKVTTQIDSIVRATVETTTLTCTTKVTIKVPTAASVSVAAEPSTVVANGTNRSRIAAVVKDSGGVGISGVTVTFSVDNTAIAVLLSTQAQTNNDGRATVELRSAAINAMGTVTVTAREPGGKQGTVTVSFVAQPSLTVSVSPTTIPAGGVGSTALVTATVKAADGTPVPGQKVNFGFNIAGAPTASPTGATTAPAYAMSDSGGLAYATLTSPPNLDHGNADVILAWMDSNASNAFEAAEDRWAIVGITYTEPPATVTVAAVPTAIPADATSTSKITALVLTALPAPVGPGLQPVADGTLVRFQTSSGTFVGTGTNTATATTVSGVAWVTLRASDVVGAVTVSATAASVTGSTQVQFQTVPDRILTLSATPGSLATGGNQAVITASLRQSDGTPVAAATITFTTNLGTLTPAPASCITGVDGKCTITFTSGVEAGTATVTAASGEQFASILIPITGGAPARIDIGLAGSARIAATGGLPSPAGAAIPVSTTIAARVTDANGNPVPDGTPVLFHTDIGTIQASAPTVNGVATATLVSSSFDVATNFATYKPGVASVNAVAGSEGGPKAGPVHVIFSGNVSYFTQSGAPNDTDLISDYGADWRTGVVGGSGSEPNLQPMSRDSPAYTFWVSLFDANNNPLPFGVPVTIRMRLCGIEKTVDTTTGIYPSSARADFNVTELGTGTPHPGTCLSIVDVNYSEILTPGVAQRRLPTQQWFGAAAPASISPPPQPPTIIVGATCCGGTSVTFVSILDKFGNRVQDGTRICFGYDTASLTNMTGIPTLTPTIGSTVDATSTVLVYGCATKDKTGKCNSGTLTVTGTVSPCTTDSPKASVTVNWKTPS
jgi:hypothetical protein